MRVVICAQVFFLCVAMDFSHYQELRPFGCFTYLELGFTSLLSNLVSGIQEREVLRLANRARLIESQAVIDAIFSRIEGLPLMDRTDVLAGREMCSAVAVMSAAVTECTVLCHRASHPVLTPRPRVRVRRPRLASEAAYRALTLCVFPKHCGYLESYEMDQGVRLVKAGLLVAEYEGFASRVDYWYGDMIHAPVVTLIRNLRGSVLARLRRLSLAFVPVGSRDKLFLVILDHIRALCVAGGSCYRVAQLDPLRPRAIEYLYAVES